MAGSSDRLFLTILRGPSPQRAEPILASEDQDLIRAVGRELGAQLGVEDSSSREAFGLRLVREDGEGER